MKSAGKQEILQLEPCMLDPNLQGVPGGRCDLELDWALRLVLHDDGACRHLIAMAHVPNLKGDEITSAQLAVDAKVKSASSRTRLSNCRRTRSAQMSFGLKGAFCPTIFPLFQGSRRLALPSVPMMVSHRVEGGTGCARGSHRRALLPVNRGAACARRRLSASEMGSGLTVSAMSGHWRPAA